MINFYFIAALTYAFMVTQSYNESLNLYQKLNNLNDIFGTGLAVTLLYGYILIGDYLRNIMY